LINGVARSSSSQLSEHMFPIAKSICSITFIKFIAIQLLEVLSYLKKKSVIHADINLDNILLKNERSVEIVLIDFGGSIITSTTIARTITLVDDGGSHLLKKKKYLQSRFYRSPEVLLGLKYDYEIDMWSSVCILPELRTGRPLFTGDDETDQLYVQGEFLGHMPSDMVAHCPRRDELFNEFGDFKILQPKTRGSVQGRTSSSSARRQQVERVIGSKSFASDVFVGSNPDRGFINFLLACFKWDPKLRLTCDDALQHPWIVKGPFASSTSSVDSGIDDIGSVGHLSMFSNSVSDTSSAAPMTEFTKQSQLLLRPSPPLSSKPATMRKGRPGRMITSEEG